MGTSGSNTDLTRWKTYKAGVVLAKRCFYDLDGDALEYELRYDWRRLEDTVDYRRLQRGWGWRIVTTGNTRSLLGLNFGASNTSNYVTLCVEARDRHEENDPEVMKVIRCFGMDFTNKNWPE